MSQKIKQQLVSHELRWQVNQPCLYPSCSSAFLQKAVHCTFQPFLLTVSFWFWYSCLQTQLCPFLWVHITGVCYNCSAPCVPSHAPDNLCFTHWSGPNKTLSSMEIHTSSHPCKMVLKALLPLLIEKMGLTLDEFCICVEDWPWLQNRNSGLKINKSPSRPLCVLFSTSDDRGQGLKLRSLSIPHSFSQMHICWWQ